MYICVSFHDGANYITKHSWKVIAGFAPSKQMLKKVRRRCIREMDYDSNDRVDYQAKSFKIRMGTENRRDMLFNLDFGTNYVA